MTRGIVLYLYRAFFMLMVASFCFPAIGETSGSKEIKPFLVSSASNRTPFVGQEVVLTYTLYFREQAPKISDEVNPSLQGVWARESAPDRYMKSMPATVHGEPFRSAVIKQFRLIPVQRGKITVSGYSMMCALESVASGMEELPDNRFRLTAPDIVIVARPLPEPVPEGFSGAVGTFRLELLADKESLRAGESLGMKLMLTGTGNLQTLKLPDIPLPESFRQNPPVITTALHNESGSTSGSITATIMACPQAVGDFHIPATRMAVFNPDTKQFSTLLSKPLNITVAAAQSTQESEGPQGKRSDEKSGKLSALLSNPAIALLLLLTGSALFLAMKKGLNHAKTLPSDNRTEPFTDSGTSAEKLKQQLFALLEEAGIKSPGGLTRVELNNALQAIAIPDEARSSIPEMLDSLDKILFSPSGEKESGSLEKIATTIHGLLKVLKTASSSR